MDEMCATDRVVCRCCCFVAPPAFVAFGVVCVSDDHQEVVRQHPVEAGDYFMTRAKLAWLVAAEPPPSLGASSLHA